MRPNAKIHQVFQFREPVRVKTELGSDQPAHADMLRYDIGFHAPEDPSFIVLPIFRYKKTGSSSRNITEGRWKSFSMRLIEVGFEHDEQFDRLGSLGSWVTYRHTDNDYTKLVAETLEKFLEKEKCQIVSFR